MCIRLGKILGISPTQQILGLSLEITNWYRRIVEKMKINLLKLDICLLDGLQSLFTELFGEDKFDSFFYSLSDTRIFWRRNWKDLMRFCSKTKIMTKECGIKFLNNASLNLISQTCRKFGYLLNLADHYLLIHLSHRIYFCWQHLQLHWAPCKKHGTSASEI